MEVDLVGHDPRLQEESLDLLIEATPDNARRLLDALLEAGIGTASLTTPQNLVQHEITVFKDVVRIDVQTSTPGISFPDAWSRKVAMVHAGQEFYVACREDLIASKRAAGREVDLRDVDLLENADRSEDG